MYRLSLALTAILISASASAVITPQTVDSALARMSLEQKARMLVGVGGCNSCLSHYTPGAAGWTYEIKELGIPSINLADGPVGVRINPQPWQENVVEYDANGIPVAVAASSVAIAPAERPSFCTAFPSTTALAATWNRDMAYMQGTVMGDEARCYGIDVILCPGINIMRNPLCGRNFEYYSEDPLLTGTLAASLISGIQDQGIGTSLKHLIANNQQTGKKVNDARMTQRALREIYARPFEIAVKTSHPWTVMGSYNKIAGEFTQTNAELMRTLLRDEWGFDGLALTDWTVWRPAEGLLNARCPLIMPGNEDRVQEIIAAVESGKVSQETLDECVRDVLNLVARSITARGWQKSYPDAELGADASRRVAQESMVLLKNDRSTLPLKPGVKVALFGSAAYKTIGSGTGSSNVNKKYIIDIAPAMAAAGFTLDPELAELYARHIDVQETLLGNDDCPDWMRVSYNRTVIPELDLGSASALIGRQAERNDVAVVVIGRKSGETSDRAIADDYNLTAAEQALISRVADAFHARGKEVVVVLNTCGALEMGSWYETPDATLVAWLPGQEAGHAVADVLSGRANPSGRLPMTLPMAYADNPASRNYPRLGQTGGRNFDYTEYQEDIWVGYRYFDAAGRAVAYPFGYGLSYTTFDYSNLKARRRGDATEFTVKVTNTGNTPGKEVVQLYVSAPASTMLKPVAELRGFAKTRLLEPGESQEVAIRVSDADLASFDQDKSAWVSDAGTYTATLRRPGYDTAPTVDFKIAKPVVRPVNNILAPVETIVPWHTINPYEEARRTPIVWVDADTLPLLGKVYPESLPRYARVPESRKDITRYEVYELGQHSSGMAIRFRSNSPTIKLRWSTVYSNDMTHMAPIASRGLDLYVLTADSTWRYIGPGRPSGNPSVYTPVANMTPEMREYMVHLPLYDGLDHLEIGIEQGSVVEQPAVASPGSEKPIVIYGTSIQHGATASRPGMVASNILRRRFDRDVINLGFSANGRLDYEIAEMMADVDAAVYVLDNIPNSRIEEINEKTARFVEILRSRRPDVPIIFVECSRFPSVGFDQAFTTTYGDRNVALRQVYDDLVAAGLDNTYYIEQDRLQPADGEGQSDEYHYTDISYRLYADTLSPILSEIFAK